MTVGAALLGAVALASCESSGTSTAGDGGSANVSAATAAGRGSTAPGTAEGDADRTSAASAGAATPNTEASGAPPLVAARDGTGGATMPATSPDAGTNGTGVAGPPIVALFDGVDLDGWTAYRQSEQNAPGTRLTDAEAQRIFKPEDGAIRVYGDEENGSTQARHTLVSALSYSKYRLWLEYRWGTRTFAPYADVMRYPRDAGLLFHIHGDTSVVWPSSMEFQIKDGTTGDIYALYARCTSLAADAQSTSFLDSTEGGVPKLVDGANGFVQHGRSANFELPGWNSLELQVDRDVAVYFVNGHVINRIVSVTDRSGTAVTEGPIALQAEHAEVFYRNVRIQVLP